MTAHPYRKKYFKLVKHPPVIIMGISAYNIHIRMQVVTMVKEKVTRKLVVVSRHLPYTVYHYERVLNLTM